MRIIGYGLLFVIVIMLAGGGFLYYSEGPDAFSLETVALREEREVSGEGIQRVRIQTGPTDVRVMEAVGATRVTVELEGEVSTKLRDAYELEVRTEDGELQVELSRKVSPSFTVFAINRGVQLTVHLPERLYEELQVHTASGDVSVRQVEAVRMELHAGSGDVRLLPASATYTLDFASRSGDGVVNAVGLQIEAQDEHRIAGRLGAGERAITVRTASGDFVLD
ncbi:DUF4097 domain-containing protein [Paenibacillus sp. TRM 82003]|nr:DUF4097 domain-containing protein [Paenibacillus sp. TRM 82003]